jgi:hypothetical protein
MLMTKRRVEIRAKVLAACEELIGLGRYPTGRALVERCGGHTLATVVRLRDEFIAAQLIDHTVLWPNWTEARFVDGPDPNRRPHAKRRDARRAECEVTS